MICAICIKDKKLNVSVPGVSGKVCANCYKIWRKDNIPGFREKSNAKDVQATRKWKANNRAAGMLSCAKHWAKRYGYAPPDITVEELEAALAVPGRVCQCGSTKRLCLDHDHKTGRVRGWLCDIHNRALGHFDDDAGLLRIFADYLDRAPLL